MNQTNSVNKWGLKIISLQIPQWKVSISTVKMVVLNPVVFALFVWGVFVPLKNFSLIWRRHHYQWRAAKFDLYSAFIAIELWRFLTRHTHCDTGHSFIMVMSKDHWNSQLLISVWKWTACTAVFNDLVLLRLGFEHLPSVCEPNAYKLFHHSYMNN